MSPARDDETGEEVGIELSRCDFVSEKNIHHDLSRNSPLYLRAKFQAKLMNA